jgi:hypothetical protein
MKKEKLHNINKTGFKTPNLYFDSFDERLLEQLDHNDLIEGVRNTGFTTPKDYFDSIELNTLEKLNNQETPVIKLKSRTLFYSLVGIAASIAIVLSVFLSKKEMLSLETIETVAIENYLYQEDYTGDDLASLFTEGNISETDFIDITISDELLNQYLETIDTEELFSN